MNHATNRLTNATVAGTTYTTGYDFAGNVTSFAGTTFSWDSLSVMTARSDGQAPQFVYDANDERIGTHRRRSRPGRSATRPAGWCASTQPAPPREDRTGAATTGRGRGPHLSRRPGSGEHHAERGRNDRDFHLDHLGTPRLVTVNGTETGFKTYYPYGSQQAAAPIESPEENLRFTGHEFDAANNGRFDTFYMHAGITTPRRDGSYQ